MTTDLIVWFRERLDEDEQFIREHMGDDDGQVGLGVAFDSGVTLTIGAKSALADIAAKRAVLNLHEHESRPEQRLIEQVPPPIRKVSGSISLTITPAPTVPAHWEETGALQWACHHCDDDRDYGLGFSGWCPTVRHLAAAYADRPGYQEAWRP